LRRGAECAYVQHRDTARFAGATVRWPGGIQFARELQKRSIGKGDRVLLWGPNSAEWVAGFFCCALRGVIVVPIDDAGASDFAQRVYQQVDAKLLLCSREHAHFFPSALIPVLFLDDLREALSSHSSAPYHAAGINPADTLEIVFTSGTTAEPKGVVISHGNVLGNIAPLESEIQRYLKYERLVHPVRFLNLLPLSHVFGQFLGIFLPNCWEAP
jgi:long-chain acyl-CoA synthetase